MHFVDWILFTIRLDWIGLNVYCKMIRSLISSDSDYCLNHQLIVYHFIKNTNFFVCADVSIHLLDKLLGRWAVSTLNPQTRITHLLLFLSFFLISCLSFYFWREKRKTPSLLFLRVLAFKIWDINNRRVVVFFLPFICKAKKKLQISAEWANWENASFIILQNDTSYCTEVTLTHIETLNVCVLAIKCCVQKAMHYYETIKTFSFHLMSFFL